MEAAGVPVVRAPADKDETDLELALAQALADDAQPIVICGALGGRTDHLLANVCCWPGPTWPDEMSCSSMDRRPCGCSCTATGGEPAQLTLPGAAGDLLSLLPLGGGGGGRDDRGLLLSAGRRDAVSRARRAASATSFADTTAQITLRAGGCW